MIKAKEDDLKKFGPSKIVLKAYSGKPGCACGCLGKYYYQKATQELGTKDRGYKVDDDEVSDVQVQKSLIL